MIKCTKGQIRRLKTELQWKIPPEQRQRIQMVLLRESRMTQPLIAAAIRLILSQAEAIERLTVTVHLPRVRLAAWEQAAWKSGRPFGRLRQLR
jgi:hypothetical protein